LEELAETLEELGKGGGIHLPWDEDRLGRMGVGSLTD
jgi:hypothetical protein